MLHNYLKIAVRTLFKHKVFSLINVAGLAVSMSVCLLVILFIAQQKSYDQFHANAERIYRVYSDFKAPHNADSQLYGTSPAALGPLLMEYSGVEEAVRIKEFSGIAEYGGRHLGLEGLFVDPAFFRVFDFALAAGDSESVLADPFSLVLSPAAASRFFGQEQALGRSVVIAEQTFTVTGILQAPLGPSHLSREALLSYAALEAIEGAQYFEDWQQSIYTNYTFLLLALDADAADLAAQLPALVADKFPTFERQGSLKGLHLQALTEISLGTIMSNELGTPVPALFAYSISVLAGLIMLLACFNYTSLSVARALTRARVLCQYLQFRYMHETDYGFRHEHIVNVRLEDVPYEVFRQQVESHSGIAQVSGASLLPMSGRSNDIWMRVEGGEKPQKISQVTVDYDFVSNLDIDLIAGRNFAPEFSSDHEEAVILNRTALRKLGWRSPDEALGRSVALGYDQQTEPRQVQVVGVVEDYQNRWMLQEIAPIALFYDPHRLKFANIRVHDGQLAAVIEHL